MKWLVLTEAEIAAAKSFNADEKYAFVDWIREEFNLLEHEAINAFHWLQIDYKGSKTATPDYSLARITDLYAMKTGIPRKTRLPKEEKKMTPIVTPKIIDLTKDQVIQLIAIYKSGGAPNLDPYSGNKIGAIKFLREIKSTLSLTEAKDALEQLLYDKGFGKYFDDMGSKAIIREIAAPLQVTSITLNVKDIDISISKSDEIDFNFTSAVYGFSIRAEDLREILRQYDGIRKI